MQTKTPGRERPRSMNRLLLLRHAKSSWDDPSLADHERPLARRGHRAAESMAEHLRSSVPHPDLVLCSSALRTRETLDRMSKAFGDAEVMVDDDLYGATEELLLERLRGVADRFETVAIIGHNPGVHDLAIALAGSGADLDRMRAKFPTGALAALAFDGPWRELAPGDARLEAFVTPKDLA
jgi:phosphohistidine phosphatase